MKRKNQSDYFTSVGSVVNNLINNLGLEKGLKISSLSKMWPKIIGPRFEKTSKIFSVYDSNGFDVIVIAVSSSSVAQELSFYKNDILKKTSKIGKNFGFKIKDIKFSTNFWKEEQKN